MDKIFVKFRGALGMTIINDPLLLALVSGGLEGEAAAAGVVDSPEKAVRASIVRDYRETDQ